MTETKCFPFAKFISSVSITGYMSWMCSVPDDASDADKQFATFITALGTVIRRCNSTNGETNFNKSQKCIVPVKIDEIVKHPSYKTVMQMFNEAHVQFYCDKGVFNGEFDAVEIVCDYSYEIQTRFLVIPVTVTHFVICIKRGYHALTM